MSELTKRPTEDTSPTLQLVIGALLLIVVLADLWSPLGLAVWVFYMVPLGACLFSRSPQLPLRVGMGITAALALLVLKPLGGEELVERWLALGNRCMYVAMLWPVAFMIQRLIAARRAIERDEWLERTQGSVLAALQGELPVPEVAARALRGLTDALRVPLGALYVNAGPP